MRVLVTDAEFPDLAPERAVLEAAGFTVVTAQCRTPQEVIEAAEGCDALIVQYAPVTREVFESRPQLRVVSRYGVGVDSIDVAAATAHGVWVANVPDYGVEEVSVHTAALLLGLVRHIPFLDRDVRDGTWDFAGTGTFHRLSTLTLGLVGLGRIGRAVAELVGDSFREVLAYDPFVPDERWPRGVRRAEMDEVFERSRAVSLHLPLTVETRGVIGSRLFDLAPPGGTYLVNTARGGLVDLDALVAALDDGRVRGAALDVLPEEPPPGDHPVLRHPRAVITPHAAFYSEESAADLRRMTAENIVRWRIEGRPRSVVNDPTLAEP
jgi:D-3-phosphoglycerate dehydrogenase